MLRAAVLALGVALLGAAVAVAALGPWPVALELAAVGALVVVGTALERRLYRGIEPPPPGPDWQRTTERFRDPTSGQVVTVWFNARTGERRYGGGQ
jgi:membrane protein implicated in regulation of membrane protease activity